MSNDELSVFAEIGVLTSLERLCPCSQPACQLAVPFVWASDMHIKEWYINPGLFHAVHDLCFLQINL